MKTRIKTRKRMRTRNRMRSRHRIRRLRRYPLLRRARAKGIRPVRKHVFKIGRKSAIRGVLSTSKPGAAHDGVISQTGKKE